MGETGDLMRLRLRNLELLRRLWAGQAAVQQLVAQATSEDKCHTWESLDTHADDPCDTAWLGRAPSRVSSLPPAKYQHPETLGPPRPCSTPLPATGDPEEPSADRGEHGPQEARAPKSILARHSRKYKPRVTFEEFTVPESSWRLRPYLGYDWIAGSLDSSSPISSKPEAFFSMLQEFREAHRGECIHSHHEPFLQGPREGGDVEKDHECVYSYRVNRRLFLVPSDPGIPCRLCGTPRDQRGPETLAEPAQVQVSVPLSVLDAPHRYRVHRRKSFDSSDTLALPRHCLLGWDIAPLKPERSSVPRSLDLVSEAQHRKLSAASSSRLALPGQGPRPTPMWSETQVPRLHGEACPPGPQHPCQPWCSLRGGSLCPP